MRRSLFFFFLPALAHAAVTEGFIEELESKNSQPASYQRYKEKNAKQDYFMYGLRAEFDRFTKRVSVPGFISAAPIANIATVVGPNGVATLRMGDTVFLRWTGNPGPRVGDRYHTFAPAVVLQNTLNPTDFIVRNPPNPEEKLPRDFRLAGFFYEANGTLRITRITQGLVEAVVEKMTGRIAVGHQLMPLLPTHQSVEPIVGGIQLAAAIVAGSPVDRLTAAAGSTIYINRGARDGMRVGRVFEAVETVRLENVDTINPELSVGEAMVIYVTDAYSTAIITKQFDVIRVGSLLKTKQDFSPTREKRIFQTEAPEQAPVQEPEIPSATGDALISELDALERKMEIRGLSPEEKARLDRLSRQQRESGQLSPVPVDEIEAVPGLPASGNSFQTGQPQSKKDDKSKKKKKQQRTNDEEELNLLMMQN